MWIMWPTGTCRGLGLPAQVHQAAEWDDIEVVEHFWEHQEKVAACASGLHWLLGLGPIG